MSKSPEELKAERNVAWAAYEAAESKFFNYGDPAAVARARVESDAAYEAFYAANKAYIAALEGGAK